MTGSEVGERERGDREKSSSRFEHGTPEVQWLYQGRRFRMAEYGSCHTLAPSHVPWKIIQTSYLYNISLLSF